MIQQQIKVKTVPFGKKTKELFNLMETIPNWEIYVSGQTKEIVSKLFETKSMIRTMTELNLKYPTIRSHIIRAIYRINEKKRDKLRDGKSIRAQYLFSLVEQCPEWEKCLTNQEILLVNKFMEVKNFYEVGRELKLIPSNVAITLYGSKQKLGVVGKIQKLLPAEVRYQ